MKIIAIKGKFRIIGGPKLKPFNTREAAEQKLEELQFDAISEPVEPKLDEFAAAQLFLDRIGPLQAELESVVKARHIDSVYKAAYKIKQVAMAFSSDAYAQQELNKRG